MNKTVHIIGGGQLAQMLALSAIPLGIEALVLDPNSYAPANLVASHILGTYTQENLINFVCNAEVITFEFENIPAAELEFLRNDPRLKPGLQALETSQDRLTEKRTFESLGIPTNRYSAVSSVRELLGAIDQLGGYPVVLKARRLGYDGKAQAVLMDSADIKRNPEVERILAAGAIVEQFVDFDYEVSCIGVFSDTEETFYPLSKNVHRSGILVSSEPLLDAELHALATQYVQSLAQLLKYRGVLTIEFFVKNGTLIANESAPRVHNSGHWTIQGCVCSQFENHIRAVSSLPLGSTALTAEKVFMWNIIGVIPRIEEILTVNGAHLHLYHKDERAGRKLGHVTLIGGDAADREKITHLLG